MGNGYYDSDRRVFQLAVSAQFDAPACVLEQWRRAFNEASKTLYVASNGYFRFETIRVSNRIGNADLADAHLQAFSGSSGSDGHLSCCGKMSLCHDDRLSPFVILHEFGHYAFWLGEEYDTRAPDYVPLCTKARNLTRACFMEFHRKDGQLLFENGLEEQPGWVSEFCCKETPHDEVIWSIQNDVHQGHSCWHVIHELYPNVPIPIPLPHRAPLSIGYVDIQWNETVDGPFLAVALDLSKQLLELLGKPTVGSLLRFQFTWLTDKPGKTIALGLGETNAPPIENTDAIPQFVEKLFRHQKPEADDWSSLLQFVQSGMKYADPNIMLVSDRVSAPPDSIPKSIFAFAKLLRQNWTRFQGIGFVPRADLSLWQTISAHTKGGFRTATIQNAERCRISLIDAWLELVISVADNNSLVWQEADELPAFEIPGDEELKNHDHRPRNERPPVQRRPIDPAIRSDTYDIPVLIEKGSRRATFVLTRERVGEPILFVQRPDGAIVHSTDGDVEFIANEELFQVIAIRDPQHGLWFMRLERTLARTPCPFGVLAFSANHNLFVKMCIDLKNLARSEVDVNILVACPIPVAGIVPPVVSVFLHDDSGELVAPAVMQIVLKPDRLGNSQRPTSAPWPNGRYVGTIHLPGPGIYTLAARVVNNGSAIPVYLESTSYSEENPNQPVEIPPFSRTMRKQVSCQN